MWVSQGSSRLEFMDDVIGHIVEGGIFIHIRNRCHNKVKIKSKFNCPTFDDTYIAISYQTPANGGLSVTARICIGSCLFCGWNSVVALQVKGMWTNRYTYHGRT